MDALSRMYMLFSRVGALDQLKDSYITVITVCACATLALCGSCDVIS